MEIIFRKKKSAIYKWLNCFKKVTIEEKKKSAYHWHQFVRKKLDAVRNVIDGNRRLTAEIIVNSRDISAGSADTILSERL